MIGSIKHAHQGAGLAELPFLDSGQRIGLITAKDGWREGAGTGSEA